MSFYVLRFLREVVRTVVSTFLYDARRGAAMIIVVVVWGFLYFGEVRRWTKNRSVGFFVLCAKRCCGAFTVSSALNQGL